MCVRASIMCTGTHRKKVLDYECAYLRGNINTATDITNILATLPLRVEDTVIYHETTITILILST